MRYILELKQSLSNKAISEVTDIPLGTVQDYIIGKRTKHNKKILEYVNNRIEEYKCATEVHKRPLE